MKPNRKTFLIFLSLVVLMAPVSARQGQQQEHEQDPAEPALQRGTETIGEAPDTGEHDQHADHRHHERKRPADSAVTQMAGDVASDTASQWTCPMHPRISRDGPGQCPICGMELVERARDDGDEMTVRVPGRIQQSMNLRTAPVQRGQLSRRIDSVGRVQVDETHLQHLHPRVDGWIGELDVNAMGEPVEAGQRLFTLYSRELLNVQEEFLRALRSGGGELISAARDRLAALDVQPQVIERIERDREVLDHIPWYAERSGYVQALNIRPGMFVAPGSDMIVLADPDRVWVIADVFAGQIAWIEAGQPVEIEREARPGQLIEAEIDFVYPELDPVTKTARARIELEGTGLRPGEWTSLTIDAGAKNDVVFVPTEAVIRTGSSTRVIVRTDEEAFSVREVRTGLVSGENTEVLHGVSEGESVVTSGHFLIDSEANLRAGFDRLGGEHDH
ncbi:MAG: HlyD family efflux transporter periplasmic adaptor subunit [Gammaproteobacteria bacterium]|jgi:Cu(I)/Ag(I) efflux system membrane fusion protein|nr:HlyD family efflux transporter periplasmic adaptor subunit [Gammaproteobacteria bacterium]